MKLFGYFFSKRPDGLNTYGVGVVVVICLVPLVLFLLITKGERKITELQGKGVNLVGVSEAVRNGAAVSDMKRTSALAGSDDLVKEVNGATAAGSKPGTASTLDAAGAADASPAKPSGTNNAMDIALVDGAKELEKERPQQEEDGGFPGAVNLGPTQSRSRSPETTVDAGTSDNPYVAGLGGAVAPSGGTRNTKSGQQASLANLVVYRRKDDAPSAPPVATQPVEKSKYAQGSFLPRGQYIELFLLDTVRTDQPQPIITLGVAKDVIFGGKVFIPFGTRVLATAGGGSGSGRRVMIAPSSFQFPDGTEISVSAVIKDMDGAVGVEAYYIPPPTWVQLSGYVNDFMAGYIDLLYLKQQQKLGVTIGSVSVGVEQPKFDPQNEALATTSDVIKRFASAQMTELQSRYAPYLVAPAGTKVRMQLTGLLSIEDRGVNVAPQPAPAVASSPSRYPSIPGIPAETLEAVSQASRGLSAATSNAGR